MTDLAETCRREIVELHAFFVAWCRNVDGPELDFDGLCERAFAPDMRMVRTDGSWMDRATLVSVLRGARRGDDPDFTITIEDVVPVWHSGDAALLHYVERQYRDGRTTLRRSIALFTREPSAPRGVVWRHLQETWMQAG